MGALWNIFSFIIAIGILVTIHEYGHYKVARWCGVKVLKFSIGFGKPLYKWLNKEGTEFVIAAIPLGGYVRMLDARLDDVPEHEKSQAFNYKTVQQRIAVVAAGPLANLLFAIVALWGMYLIGVPEVRPVIKETVAQSPAAQAGLHNEAEIVSINGHPVTTWQQVNIELMDALGESSLQLAVLPQNQSYQKNYTIDLKDWTVDPEKGNLISELGIVPFRPEILPELAHVAEQSPAASAGLQKGDKILSYNQGRAFDWQEMSSWIRENPGQTVNLEIERNGVPLELSVTIGVRERNNQQEGYLGVAPTLAEWPQAYRFHMQFGILDGLVEATQKTWRLITLSFSMIEKLLTGDVSYKSLSGPISIAQGAGQSAGLGVVYFLSFLALISVNLGIINLLPLPVLDGGHLVYYLIEFVSGKPVPERVQEIGFRIGAVIIFCMMSVAILNDLSRW
ncbi:sigma E protease regulator RseP [Catenovulum sediminis]|uniref:Zinc metalloprotease n=1 Tax=Catenovulum sediminis TaxID=1740262 RepID=A0ABV1RJA8_9ALTE|nr:sigma E protease regulator RseP [Catenovulum sediminis]